MALPTIATLVTPNFTGNTLLGIVLIAIGIFVVYISAKLFDGKTFETFNIEKIGILIGAGILALGIFLSFIVSFIQDIFASEELVVILVGTIVLIMGGVLLFYKPKK